MNLSETALSIKQPWAYLIAAGIKDIENRTWKCPEKYIGKRVLIHASAKHANNDSRFNYAYALDSNQRDQAAFNTPNKRFIIQNACSTTSAIIGSVEIVACVVNHTSIWAGKTEDSNCPLCHRIIENKKEDRQFCVDCRRVLDKGIDYYDTIYNWVLANPILFDEPIMNVKGMLGFWKYTHSISQNEVFSTK